MFNLLSLCIAVGLLTSSVLGQSTVGQYGQCGGIGWSGATLCPSGWTCTVVNDYYFQCLPGGSTSNPGGGSGPTTTTTAAGGTATLEPGWSWIRAVVDPNFHKYLRSQTKGAASPAVVGEPADAAQFQIANGQLVQKTTAGSLYAVVQATTDTTAKKLAVTWSTSPVSNGTFVASGDTIEWSSPSVSRPQANAWLVCPDTAGNKLLYVNLGPYDYQTPAGCADQTIHYYTGSTATA